MGQRRWMVVALYSSLHWGKYHRKLPRSSQATPTHVCAHETEMYSEMCDTGMHSDRGMYRVIQGCIKWRIDVLGGAWMYSVAQGCTQWYRDVLSDAGMYSVMKRCTMWCRDVRSDAGMYSVVHGSSQWCRDVLKRFRDGIMTNNYKLIYLMLRYIF